MRAHSRSRTERAQCHSCVGRIFIRGLTAVRVNPRLDFPAHSRHRCRARVAQSRQTWLAPQTSAESFLLCGFRQWKEFHLFKPRFPRRARRPAVDSRGPHGINKRAIRAAIARLHRQPLFLARRQPAHAAKTRSGRSGHQFHHCMSLAPALKLAKLNQTRYPFLARELSAKFSDSAPGITSQTASKKSPVFGSLSYSANKEQTPNSGPLATWPTATTAKS